MNFKEQKEYLRAKYKPGCETGSNCMDYPPCVINNLLDRIEELENKYNNLQTILHIENDSIKSHLLDSYIQSKNCAQ